MDRDKKEQETRLSRGRADLASRLFRPHWPFVWSRRTEPQGALRSAAGRPYDGFDRGRQRVDVICAGMYRACSTWQYEVVAHLIEEHLEGQRLGYMTGEQYAELTRIETARARAEPARPARWRLLKSHEGDRSFARALAEGRAIAVYAHRDVREVVFSLMHKRGLSFEQLLRQGMIHQVLANDRFWRSFPGTLVQRYDDLTAAPAVGVTELAQHLGLAIDEREAQSIALTYSAESNRARTEALRRRLHEAGVDLDSATNAQICDPTTLLHWNHMRHGAANSWRSAATQRQRAILEKLCGRWLEEHGYPRDESAAGGRSGRFRSLSDVVQEQGDLLAARRTFLARSAAQRLPGVARMVKRALGIPLDTRAGATAWADEPAEQNADKPAAASPVTARAHVAVLADKDRS